MKKIIFVISLMFLLFLLSSCDRKSYEEYIPDAAQYSDWDGNYFYYANYRCKSNLTDEEIIIGEVNYNDKTYKINDVYDCKFKDEKLYMIFPVNDGSGYYREIYSLLIIYSLKTNEIEYMYKYEFENNKNINFHEILFIDDSYLIVESENNICKLDLRTNEIQIVRGDDFKIINEYLIITYEEEILVSSCKDFNFQPILSYSQTNSSTSFSYYVELVDGRPILIIHEHLNNFEDIQIKCYDLIGKKMFELLQYSPLKRISFDSDKSDIFIIGEEKTIKFKTRNDGVIDKKIIVNNILYRIRANEDSIYLEEMFVFDDNTEYVIDKFNGDLIYLYSTKYSKSFLQIHYNKTTSEFKYFDIITKSVLEEVDYIEQEIIPIAEYNGYTYYFKIEYYLGGIIGGGDWAYYLHRKNITTNEEELLQFFFLEQGASQCYGYNNYFLDYDKDNIFDYNECLIRSS